MWVGSQPLIDDLPKRLRNVASATDAHYREPTEGCPAALKLYWGYECHVLRGRRATQIWDALCAAALWLPTEEEAKS